MNQLNINLMAPINQLGYGIAGLNILKALQKRANVALHLIGQPQITTQENLDAVNKGLEVARFFDVKAPCVKVWHQHDMSQFVGKGQHIGFPIFELDTFNDIEKHNLGSCDKLFVCSEWAKNILYNHKEWSSPRVSVVPLGVDMNIFKPSSPTPKDNIVFFNCGKWEIRKGHDILIQAFKKISAEYNNVELWMMCANPFNSNEENARWHQLYNHPKIKIIPRAETQMQVYNIMSQITCGVFPSRGEGWNLELLEIMACGKHAIATNYSAHTQFCTQANCGLINIKETESAFDGKWFFNQGNWAKIGNEEIDILVNLMKVVIKNYNCELNNAGIETAKQFSWDNTATQILNNLD